MKDHERSRSAPSLCDGPKAGSERNLSRELEDSRARAENDLRAQGCLECRPRCQADGWGAGTRCRSRGGELGGAQRSIVDSVEGVVRLQDELRLDALSDRNGFGDSRIERNEVGKIEGVPGESRRTVSAADTISI